MDDLVVSGTTISSVQNSGSPGIQGASWWDPAVQEERLASPVYHRITSYGGNPAIIATRAEIERVQAGIVGALNLLIDNPSQIGFLINPLSRLNLVGELLPIQQRLHQLLQALDIAANQYFDGDALIAKELTDVGIGSAPFLSSVIIGIANGFGLLRENRVTAIQLDRFSRPPPVGLSGLGKRLDQISGAGEIVVERYDNKFVVYIPGTQTWNPFHKTNPIDLTSNLHAMRQPGVAASERGVTLALAAAGASASSKVLLVGYSQGGMASANIALTDKRVKGLVTFGAPISQVAEQIKVPTVAIQHVNDIVPKLGVKANPLLENMVTVERLMPVSSPIAGIGEAHDLSNYAKTAELADKSEEIGLKRVREQVLDGVGVKMGETTVYRLERVG